MHIFAGMSQSKLNYFEVDLVVYSSMLNVLNSGQRAGFWKERFTALLLQTFGKTINYTMWYSLEVVQIE